MEALPLDMLYEVAKFAAGDMGDLKTLSLLCRTGQSLAANLAANENAKLYENEFRKRDPVLHECIAQSEDARSTWKGRLVKIIQYKHDSKRDVLSLDAAAVGGAPPPRKRQQQRKQRPPQARAAASSRPLAPGATRGDRPPPPRSLTPRRRPSPRPRTTTTTTATAAAAPSSPGPTRATRRRSST